MPPADNGADSRQMNATQNQFSLNRAASKQIQSIQFLAVLFTRVVNTKNPSGPLSETVLMGTVAVLSQPAIAGRGEHAGQAPVQRGQRLRPPAVSGGVYPVSEAMTTLERQERVRRAIAFRQPDRVPVVFWNRDQTSGDIMLYHLSLGAPGDGTANAWEWAGKRVGLPPGENPATARWAIRWKPLYRERAAAGGNPRSRAARGGTHVGRPRVLRDLWRSGTYRLASLDLSGFTVYTLLRGFDNAMEDFLARKPDGLCRR